MTSLFRPLLRRAFPLTQSARALSTGTIMMKPTVNPAPVDYNAGVFDSALLSRVGVGCHPNVYDFSQFTVCGAFSSVYVDGCVRQGIYVCMRST
jgi:hypothetical protein